MSSVLTFIWVLPCLLDLYTFSTGQQADEDGWRLDQAKHRPISYNETSLLRLCRMADIGRLNIHLDRVLVPRPVGTENHHRVALYIEQTLQALGYAIEHDRFTEWTLVGSRSFQNIIATLDLSSPRRLTLACHYDSKDMRTKYGFEFRGATDSAFPCSLLLDVAQALAPYITNREARNVTLQFLFLDGEEAFGDWSTRDSIYGSRHLADLWHRRAYPSYSTRTTELDRMDLLVLLDLLGMAGSTIPDYISINNQRAYGYFMDIETQLRQVSSCLDTSPPNQGYVFKGREAFVVEDDQLPFYRKGVPILHLVPLPFPAVWHSRRDDRSALNDQTMTNLATIVRVFVARYLGIRL